MSRLQDITPKELAQALFHLEIKKELPQLYLQLPPQIVNHTQLYFSRGIKKEMESIYLELAKHLEVKSRGSVDLMNHVFELLQKTLNSLVEVPHFISMN